VSIRDTGELHDEKSNEAGSGDITAENIKRTVLWMWHCEDRYIFAIVSEESAVSIFKG
jgi:hypothetical protein